MNNLAISSLAIRSTVSAGNIGFSHHAHGTSSRPGKRAPTGCLCRIAPSTSRQSPPIIPAPEITGQVFGLPHWRPIQRKHRPSGLLPPHLRPDRPPAPGRARGRACGGQGQACRRSSPRPRVAHGKDIPFGKKTRVHQYPAVFLGQSQNQDKGRMPASRRTDGHVDSTKSHP